MAIEIPDQSRAAVIVLPSPLPGQSRWFGRGIAKVFRTALGEYTVTTADVNAFFVPGSPEQGQDYLLSGVIDAQGGTVTTFPNVLPGGTQAEVFVKAFDLAGAAADRAFALEVRRLSNVLVSVVLF